MKYHSEDITWCMNKQCNVMTCERNPKNIRQLRPHSYAYLEGTKHCKKTKSTNNI